MTTTPTTAAPTDQIEAVRAFNRFYTARIGALRDGLLATPYPLPEARVLFELGRRGTIDAADLRRVLDLDGGYLSRLLARLEAQGLVARERSPDDGRRQRLELTAAGRGAYETLDERSAAEIGALLDELDEGDRAPPARARWARSARSSTARPGPRGSCCVPRAPATSAGSSIATARSTPSTAGTRGSRRSSRGSWPTTPRTTTPPARRAWIAEVGGSSGRLDLLRAQRRRDRAAAAAARRAGHARDGRRRRARRRVRRLRARGRLPARAPVDEQLARRRAPDLPARGLPRSSARRRARSSARTSPSRTGSSCSDSEAARVERFPVALGQRLAVLRAQLPVGHRRLVAGPRRVLRVLRELPGGAGSAGS